MPPKFKALYDIYNNKNKSKKTRIVKYTFTQQSNRSDTFFVFVTESSISNKIENKKEGNVQEKIFIFMRFYFYEVQNFVIENKYNEKENH